MYTTKKYVVLADLESVRIPYSDFAKALGLLSEIGDIAACKFYGYSAKRNRDYDDFIRENNFDALSALPRKKKGRLDLRQVIDAVRLSSFPNIDGFFLLYGAGDLTPLIAYLKSRGLDVIAGVTEIDKNSQLCSKVVLFDGEDIEIKDVLKKGFKAVEPPKFTYLDEPEEEEIPQKDEPERISNEVLDYIEKIVSDDELPKAEEQSGEDEAAQEEQAAELFEEAGEEDEIHDKKIEAVLSYITEVEEDEGEESEQSIDFADPEEEQAQEEEEEEPEEEAEEEAEEEDEPILPLTAENGEVDDDLLIAQLYQLLGGLD